MSYLKNIATGSVSSNIGDDSDIYTSLAALRDSTTGRPAYEGVSAQQAQAAPSRFIATVIPASAIAADSVSTLTLGLSHDVTISAISYTPAASITGANTNSRTVSVVSHPDAASPTTVGTLAFTSGVNAAAGTASAITVSVAALAADSSVVAKSTHVGTGIADPGGLLVVTYA